MTTIRVRFAPSPSGDTHIGTLYTALINYCFARYHKGTVILRMEDTDSTRCHRCYEAVIQQDLQWVGLNWDEGLGIGGPYGPYRQSERQQEGIYDTYIQQLLTQGHAFECFRTAEELLRLRQQHQVPLKKHHLALPAQEVKRRRQQGQPSVIRLDTPTTGDCQFNDVLRGNITYAWSQVDAQVIRKADGMPTYHLANVVDDHLMGITHIIRGEEWINSAPKHQLLYQHLGWQMPALCHLPLLRNPDKSKLSKRKGHASVAYYRAMGYLPEALINYMGRIGITLPEGKEQFTLAEIVAHFSLQQLNLGSPVFDHAKLDFLNGLWLRKDEAALTEHLKHRYFTTQQLLPVVKLLAPRMHTLSDFAALATPFFQGVIPLNKTSLKEPEQLQYLQWGLWSLEGLMHWQKNEIYDCLNGVAQHFQQPLKVFLKPFFIALSGKHISPPLFDLAEYIGKALTLARLHNAIVIAGAPSKKVMKGWQQEYQNYLK